MPVIVSSSVEIWAPPTSTMRTGKGLGKARVSGPNTMRIRWSRIVAAPSVARSAAMGGRVADPERLERRALEEHPEQPHEEHRPEHRHPEAEPEADREDHAEVRAPHHERALREVDHVEDRERDREPDGDEGVEASERQGVDCLLEEHGADGTEPLRGGATDRGACTRGGAGLLC